MRDFRSGHGELTVYHQRSSTPRITRKGKWVRGGFVCGEEVDYLPYLQTELDSVSYGIFGQIPEEWKNKPMHDPDWCPCCPRKPWCFSQGDDLVTISFRGCREKVKPPKKSVYEMAQLFERKGFPPKTWKDGESQISYEGYAVRSAGEWQALAHSHTDSSTCWTFIA